MSDVTISEEEFLRLKRLAGEVDEKPDVAMCATTGHAWQSIGGSNAGCENPDCSCSVAVYTCSLCGECDYGERDRQDTWDKCQDRAEWHAEAIRRAEEAEQDAQWLLPL